ncbi:ABC transporter permease [Thermogemmatispora onikobensis]|uniref:ABC transporter permease n=1 Tax=Thermogemmatispora onikobensis TaxID=732234 RepID=UPI0008539522|nr:ABC transporter permease subunit [Thermogemmatispora onikobensis]
MNLYAFWPMLKKEFREQSRTYRFVIAVIVFLLLGISAPIITWLTPDLLKNLGNGATIILPPQTATDALNTYLKNMVQLPALALILLAMGAIADERSRGTAVTILTKPVPRPIFVLAKFLAYEGTLIISLTLAAVGAYYYTGQLFRPLPVGPFLILNIALLAFLTLTLALTILCSALVRNSIAAGGMAFVGFLVLVVVPNLNASISRVLPSVLFRPERVAQLVAGTASLGETLWPLLVGLGLAGLLVVLTCLVYHSQEI